MQFQLAMVMFRDQPQLSIDDIQRDMAAKWPDLPQPSDSDAGDTTLSFQVGEATIMLGVMPAPIPWSDLEGPCATSILWKNAAEEIRPHQAHVIVTVMGEFDEIALSKLLTQAAASVMATSPAALGVYWCNAALVAPKEMFIDFAVEILPQAPPLHVWVDFRVGKDGDRTSAGFTTGMKALGHMEFETKNAPEPPGELRERLFGLASYVVENGPVIKDGDTIGQDANEKIRVVYSDSEFGIEGPVMRLRYEQSSPEKPWWKM